MITNNCDICGKETFFAPKQEAVMETVQVPISVPDPDKPGQTKTVEIPQERPKMTTRKVQDNITGAIKEVPTAEMKDLQERAYYFQLTMGGEYCIRDFCRECLMNEIMPLARPLWDKLASISEKE